MDIEGWLRSLGLERYEAAFRENDIDETVLPSLTEEHLKQLGVASLGHRVKLLDAIAARRNDATGKGPSVDPATTSGAPIAHPEDRAERRQVTVMFSDLVGSTALSARMDPEDLREVISAYQKCVAETVQRFGGFVAKYMGDGVLVYFGYPQAHEDDAERAVRAALELVAAIGAVKTHASLQARMGIATGLVVVGDLVGSGASQEQAIVGETPNLAARLQGMIVAVTLAIAVRRGNDLLILHAAIGRERGNLARYFSPNVVEELSRHDEPLKQVRTQNVAVLFVDIVGFTTFADARTPEEVVRTLREFHALMEQEVFRHSGTLDKYLGDGLMATFGTPFVGEADAGNALRCAQAMMAAANRWNGERKAAGEAAIRVSFGLHYGPVVLGDIGLTCLEFAVIGSTVNAASRLEALTRALDCELVTSDDLVRRAKAELGSADGGVSATNGPSPADDPRA